MITRLNPTLAACIFALLITGAARAQSGGGYDLTWHKIPGGGGTSAGGGFSLSGSAGQHDAGNAMTGGGFSVTSGFWSMATIVPTPGASRLSIHLAGAGTFKISWPSPSAGFALQQNTDLTTANWVVVSLPVNDDGTNRSVTISSTGGNVFFRLANP